MRNSARQSQAGGLTIGGLNQYNNEHCLPKILKLLTFGYLFKAQLKIRSKITFSPHIHRLTRVSSCPVQMCKEAGTIRGTGWNYLKPRYLCHFRLPPNPAFLNASLKAVQFLWCF